MRTLLEKETLFRLKTTKQPYEKDIRIVISLQIELEHKKSEKNVNLVNNTLSQSVRTIEINQICTQLHCATKKLVSVLVITITDGYE